jgi:outer membrane protein
MFVGFTRYVVLITLMLISLSGFACDENDQCVEPGEWSVGLALGLGAKTNPLVDGESIPNVLLLDIAWYGEKTYFDNGELGFRWLDDENVGIESYLTFDRERAFFKFWDPANILVNIGSVSPPSAPLPNPPVPPMSDASEDALEISIDDVERRKWAILQGNRLSYYQGTQKWSLSLETDITGVHNGQRIGLSYQKAWIGKNWRVQVKPSIVWKSDAIIDYYYGLDEADTVDLLYEGKGGLQASISFFYAYDITPKWQFIFSSSYQSLHSGMTNSPLVKDKHVSSVFIGAGYRF